MLKDKIAAFIEKIRTIDGVVACALVSRDGIIAGKYFETELNEPWFGALSATILASAESASILINLKKLSIVSVRGSDSTILVMGAGEHFLVAAVVKNTSDMEAAGSQISEVAAEIGQVM